MSVKNYGLDGIAANVELSKGGSRIKNNSGVIEARNNADDDYAIIRGATPVGDNDLATKQYVDKQASVGVVAQMMNDVARELDNTGVFTPAAGNIAMVTEVGATWDTLKRLVRYSGSTWEYLFTTGRADGYICSFKQDAVGGTDTYIGDHAYLWDGDGSVWVDIGPSTALSGFTLGANADLAYNGSSGTLKTGVTGRAIQVLVNVTTAWDGSNEDATLTVGDDGNVSRLADAASIDLYTVGLYIIDCYYEYNSIDIEYYLTNDTGGDSTQGVCDIELQYATA